MNKLKEVWNNPTYNALIRLGLWFIFFALVITFIRVSPKQEQVKEEEPKTVTYSDIKKEFTNNSLMLTMETENYYVTGVIKDNTFSGTIQSGEVTNKVYYDGQMYLVNKNNKVPTDLFTDLNTKLLLPSDIVSLIDSYNGLLKNVNDEKSYSYDIDGARYVVYVKEDKICKVTYEKDNLVYTLEYNYL